jgi:CRISPR-associated protein Csx10
MKAILLRLHLLEPLLIAQAGAGEENSAVGLTYIPGSALRGALAARWLARNRNVNDLAADLIGRTLFLDGSVCYLNAYPELNGKRTLPMPASWFTEKDEVENENTTLYDLAIADQKGTLKPPKGGPFCLLEKQEPEDTLEEATYRVALVGVDRTDQVHITLEDVNRRGEGNQVFRYEALAPDQRFIAAITARDDQYLSEIKALLEGGDLFLGSARMAGYGHVAVEMLNETPTEWQEHQGGEITNGRVVVTLLSPVIPRNDAGQVGWDGGQALARSLGLPAEAKLTASFGKMMLMGGYNRKWSLPLPQTWALTPGSVFVFETPAVSQTTLLSAIDHGIGERRAEGFGRIAINWQVAAQMTRRPASDWQEFEAPIEVSLSDESRRLAQDMAQRRLHSELDRALAKQIDAVATETRSVPSNAQLSAIRQAALSGLAQPQRSMQPLKDYLTNLKEAGKRQLESCRLGAGGARLLNWLTERANKLDVDAQLLAGGSLPQVAGERAVLTKDLKVEYTVRLIDGVMQTLARRNKEARR